MPKAEAARVSRVGSTGPSRFSLDLYQNGVRDFQSVLEAQRSLYSFQDLQAQSEAGRALFSHLISTTQCAYWKMLPRQNVDNLHAVLHRAAQVLEWVVQKMEDRYSLLSRAATKSVT